MPGAARLGDKAQTAADAHGCPSCPHPAIGPIVTGSPDVFINGKPAARKDDLGVHAVCCGPNNFTISLGSPTVYVNGRPLARAQDKTKHCGGTGPIVAGSIDVLIDDGAAAAQGLKGRAPRGRAAGAAQTTVQTAAVVSFLEISLVDQNNKPCGGVRYRVTASDRSVKVGFLDDTGHARVENLPAGTCRVTFPDLAADDWKPT